MKALRGWPFLLVASACCGTPDTGAEFTPMTTASSGDENSGTLLQQLARLSARMTKEEVLALMEPPDSIEPDERGEVCEWTRRSLALIAPSAMTAENVVENRSEVQTATVALDDRGKVWSISFQLTSVH